MKIQMNQELKRLDGVPLKDGENVVALKKPCVEALLGIYPDETGLSGEDKLLRWRLAQRIDKGGEVELAAENIALIKKLVAKAYGPLIVGQVWELLEGGQSE